MAENHVRMQITMPVNVFSLGRQLGLELFDSLFSFLQSDLVGNPKEN